MGRKLTDSEVKNWEGRTQIAKAAMAHRMKSWKKNIDRYANRGLSKPTEGELGYDDFVRVNMLYSNIKTKIPALIGQQPDIMAIPKSPEIEDRQRLLTEGVLRHYIHDWRLHKTVQAVVLDTLLMGHGILKVGYSVRTMENTTRVSRKNQELSPQEKAPDGIPEGSKEDLQKETSVDPSPPSIAAEGPVIHRVSPKHLLTHPDASFPLDKGARWVAHRTVHTKLELQYDDRFPKSWRRDLKPSEVLDTKQFPGLPRDFDPAKAEDPDLQFITLHEIWDRLTREVYVFADGNWGLGAGRVFDWPFTGMEGFPFEILVLNDLPDEAGGLTEIDPIINQLEELDKMRTFQLRHMKKLANRIYTMTENFKSGSREAIRRGTDGTVLIVDAEQARGQLELVQTATMSPDFYRAEEAIKEDLNNVSGVAEFDRGRVAGAKTATEASIIEGANRLRSDYAQGQVQDFILETLKKSFQIMQQWLPKDLAIKIVGPSVGESWETISAEDIAGEYDLRLVPGSTAPPNREVLRSQALRMYELLAGNPDVIQRELVLMLTENFPELMAGGRIDRLVKNEQAAQENLDQASAAVDGPPDQAALPQGLNGGAELGPPGGGEGGPPGVPLEIAQLLQGGGQGGPTG